MQPEILVGVPCLSDCLSYWALQVLSRRCYGKQRCKIMVNDHHFGSPCPPRVKKYLTVTYACGKNIHPPATCSKTHVFGRQWLWEKVFSCNKPNNVTPEAVLSPQIFQTTFFFILYSCLGCSHEISNTSSLVTIRFESTFSDQIGHKREENRKYKHMGEGWF